MSAPTPLKWTLLLLAGMLLLSGCDLIRYLGGWGEPTPLPAETPGYPPADPGYPAAEEAVPVTGQLEEALVPTLSFRLTTGEQDGQPVFLGLGGALEGAANPVLSARPDDVIELLLVNGGGLNDLVVEGYGMRTPALSDEGAQARLVFRADRAGRFAYYSGIPGQREAGMQGWLVVSQPEDLP